jgi:hypothetical protein
MVSMSQVFRAAEIGRSSRLDQGHARRYLEPLSEAGIIIETRSVHAAASGARQRSSQHSTPLPAVRAGAAWDDDGQ